MKWTIAIFVFLIAVQAVVALPKANPNAGHKGLAMSAGKFDRIFIMTFENQPWKYVKEDPNFKKYGQMGTLLTNFYAVTHPSQPNVRLFPQLVPLICVSCPRFISSDSSSLFFLFLNSSPIVLCSCS